MLRSYVKIAWRNILKKPFFSLVNIVGLAAGIAFTLLIGAYVWSEIQVNRQLKHADNQYIIQSRWKNPNEGMELTSIGPLARALKDNYPNLVANYYRWDGVTSTISKGDRSFREGLQIGDSTLLTMYGFELLQGNAATAFREPYSVVITEEKAKKYFGRNDVVGETLSVENFSGARHDFTITGVLKNIPRNSVTYITDDNNNQFYFSDHELAYFKRNMDWSNFYIVNYIELKDGVKPADLTGPMQHLLRQNTNASISSNLTPFLVSLKDYHLNAFNGIVRKMIYALSAIALFILLMAVINFVNLSVSRSTTRMREIGIRKVLGGVKKQLILQFLIESILLVFIATVIAIGAYLLCRDMFSALLERRLPQLNEFPAYYVALPFLLALFVGLIAGLYPAIVLSSMKSVESLKGKLVTVKEKIILRKSLVAFQFGTATIVFVGAIIISKQINLFFSKDLGYNKDYIVSVALPRDWSPEGTRHMLNIRQQFASMPEVANATLSFEVPNGNNGGSANITRRGEDSTRAKVVQLLGTDEYYAATYGIPLAAGQFFSPPGAFTDSSSVVVNEALTRALGFKTASEAVGSEIHFVGFPFNPRIAGVTKDFHFGSMQAAIEPMIFNHVANTNVYRNLSFKLKAGHISASLAALQKKWSALLPGAPFEYTFMDDSLKKVYSTELKLKQASYTATALSIVIVLLGVLGLVALSVQKRTREIGIRKVLGASLTSIVTLFLKEFLMVVLIAGLIACPLAWFIMNGWLSDYAYRITLGPAPFIISVLGLGIITAVLIMLQTLKAGSANPTNSLRSE